ncbi:MAG: dienelactone hydrolase [Deltaproteobacteria bacterium]|nr:MAG: dienelactone hydrolase [Deltaproteobacteria bacterium]
MKGYESRVFEAPLKSGAVVRHDVYERGEGPPVVLIQELPGIGPETLALADRLVAAGHHVTLPHLFGPLGRTAMVGNLARVFCMRQQFRLFAKNESSPVVDWLGALCRDVKTRRDAPGVGVIGMCLTGNFAISLMANESVLAAVASQPAMPFHSQGSLHMTPDEVSAIREGLDDKGPMYALRFEGDSMCTGAKWDALGAAFNDGGTERVRLVTLPGGGHSVLTLDFVDEEGHPTRKALDDVLGYFGERLGV